MKKTLAILGCGSRGLTVYSQFAVAHPELFQVVAVAEPRDNFRQRAVELCQLDQSKVFTDWRHLLGDGPPLADVAVISTLDRDHLEPALLAMERGYDILLEKPMDVTPQGCQRLVECARRLGRVLIVAHVLRYTKYFQVLRQIVASGMLGEIATVRHFEPVHYWHQAHSFVRGNWRNTSQTAPMILAKSCHDMDILIYLLGTRCRRLSSFGSLRHFRADKAPEQSTERCLDCPLMDEGCHYSAKRFYLDQYDQGNRGWPLDVLTVEVNRENVVRALREGPYGRCVYRCDNDAVDHQVVSLEFLEGITGTFTMTAFTDHRWRETEILGSAGQLIGDGHKIVLTDFARQGQKIPQQVEGAQPGPGGRAGDWIWDMGDPQVLKGHGGGDDGLLLELHRALSNRQEYLAGDGPEQSLHSHLMAFAADQARLSGKVIDLQTL